MRIVTSRYQSREAILASGLAPVGTTVGNPRFTLGYLLAGRCGKIAPYGLLGKGLSDDEFTAGYRARLDRFGVDEIRAALVELSCATTVDKTTGEVVSYDGAGVVLLCFEDVWAGEFCHRRLFADWWQQHTGEDVPELAAVTAPALF